jgi:hypothetical protein
VNLHISAVLEYILGIALQSVYIDVLGKHEWISSIVEFYVLQFQAIYLPESLVCISFITAYKPFIISSSVL